MTTLTAPDVTTAKPPGGPGPDRLRLRRAGAADTWYELAGGKCTIGSSPRCHVCLPAAEAQPLQCLLSLEAGAAFATKWASGVLLNGQTFAKAAFRAGDRLTIGPWEIEWDPRETPTRKSEPRAVGTPRAAETWTPVPAFSATSISQKDVPASPQLLRDTADFVPVQRKVPDAIVDLSKPSAPALAPTAIDFPAATVEAPVVTTAKRPAAKTMLLASRETDPFAQMLGPSKPVPQAPQAVGDASRSSATSQTFEDRLVASLWSSNFAARRRAKSLVAAVRKARTRARELSAGVTALEEQLAAVRSASEADQIAKAAESAELRSKIESLKAELAQAVAERDRAATDLITLQNARPQTAPPDPRLQMLADAVANSEREAAELREMLATCQEQIETLRQERAAAESALTEAETALVAAKSAQEAAEQAQAAAEALAADSKAASEAQQRSAQAAALAAERAEREQERKFADDEAARLRDQLYACESQIETLRGQVAEVDAARDQLADQLAAAQLQQTEWLAQCQTLEAQRAAEVALVVGERDELRRQLDELAARPAAAISTTFNGGAVAPEAAVEPAWAPAPEVESSIAAAEDLLPAPAALSEPIWRGWSAESEPTDEQSWDDGEIAAKAYDDCDGDETSSPNGLAEANECAAPDANLLGAITSEIVEVGAAEPPADEQAEEPMIAEAESDSPLTPAMLAGFSAEPKSAPEPEATNFTPTSFIDKYRHLLDDDAETPTWTSTPAAKHPLLDEEHMSPAKKTLASSVEEDSDEALEAYMSNMMRRMRSGGPPSSQAMPVAEPTAPEQPKLSPVEQMAAAAIAKAAAEKAESELELDENGMLRVARKPAMPTADFAALRELANSTARTAIAEHRQRRHVESAVTKAIVCVLASVASAYLMLMAPGIESPWFWGGCVTLVMAAGSAAQLGHIVWQKLRDGGRTKAGVAAGTAPEGTT